MKHNDLQDKTKNGQPQEPGLKEEGSTATAEQMAAIRALNTALEVGYQCGALDVLQDDMRSPDSINDVCDRVGLLCQPEGIVIQNHCEVCEEYENECSCAA